MSDNKRLVPVISWMEFKAAAVRMTSSVSVVPASAADIFTLQLFRLQLTTPLDQNNSTRHRDGSLQAGTEEGAPRLSLQWVNRV